MDNAENICVTCKCSRWEPNPWSPEFCKNCLHNHTGRKSLQSHEFKSIVEEKPRATDDEAVDSTIELLDDLPEDKRNTVIVSSESGWEAVQVEPEQVLEMIRRYLGPGGRGTNFYIQPDLPKRKISNVKKIYQSLQDETSIIAIYDETLLGSCKEGFVITLHGMYWRNLNNSPHFIEWKGINQSSIQHTKKGIEFQNNQESKFSVNMARASKNFKLRFTMFISDLLKLLHNEYNSRTLSSTTLQNLQSTTSEVEDTITVITPPTSPKSTPQNETHEKQKESKGNTNATTATTAQKSVPPTSPRANIDPLLEYNLKKSADSVTMLRFKFPETYPVAFETVNIPNDMKVSEAVKYISDLLHLNDSDKAIGLYVSADRVWLNDDMPLSSYKGLKFLKHIEYKLKDSTFPTSDSTKPSIETNESSKDKPATVPDRSHRQSTFIKPGRTTATTVTAPPSSPEVQELQQEVERLQGLLLEYQMMIEEGAELVSKLNQENIEYRKEIEALELRNKAMAAELSEKDELIAQMKQQQQQRNIATEEAVTELMRIKSCIIDPNSKEMTTLVDQITALLGEPLK